MSEQTSQVEEKKRPKILLISDDIRIPSGVGTMALRICTHLRSKYEICHIGAAVKHPETKPVNWNGIKIYPTSGFGNPMFLRQVIAKEKPDAIWLFTDPRFFTWIWMMEDEIRSKIPIFYYHVWDNTPTPHYNKPWYDSCDYISCISTNTYEIVKSVGRPSNLVLHGIDPKEYVVIDEESREDNRKRLLGRKYDEDIFFVLWSSRNIRRKCPSNIIEGFHKFNLKYPNSVMVMHTDAVDKDGTDLWRVHRDLFPDTPILFSTKKQPTSYLNVLYNSADVTVMLSSNEGFGLSTCESLMSGTPIIVGMTGGLKDQIVGDKGKLTGIGIKPSARNLTGSPPTPYIYEDFYDIDDFVNALEMMYFMKKENPEQMNALRKHCRKTAEKKFNLFDMVKGIDDGIQSAIKNFKPRPAWVMKKM